MNQPKSSSLRERLQELLAIPESRRTDAEWDELHELEVNIMHASGKPIATQNPRNDDRPRQPRQHQQQPQHQQPPQQQQPHMARGGPPGNKPGQPPRGKRPKSRKGRFSAPK